MSTHPFLVDVQCNSHGLRYSFGFPLDISVPHKVKGENFVFQQINPTGVV